RLLSVVGDQIIKRYQNLANIFGAALVSSEADSKTYLESVLKGEISGVKANCPRCTKREGELRLELTEKPSRDFSLLATFRPAPSTTNVPCSISGIVDLNAELREKFQSVTEEYFDDILIATSTGEVLFQKNISGIRIANLNALLPKAPESKET